MPDRVVHHSSGRKVGERAWLKSRYAAMVENNRVLRFDAIDPVDHYVSHVVFPHPVEDMYLFYSSLNAEPLMYLHPKINTTKKE